MVEAIIFDMDGVLFDTEKYYYDRRASFLAQKGISIDHLPPSFFIGGNTKQVWENILRDDYDNWDVPILQEEYNAYKQDNPLPYKELIFPDVLKVLNEVKSRGLKIGLASSSVKADILRALEENRLDCFFDVVLSGEEFKESKPNPEIYLTALQHLNVTALNQLGVKPNQALIIEDSEKGIAAGVAAGVEVWAIKDNRFGMDQGAAKGLLDNLVDVLGLLK